MLPELLIRRLKGTLPSGRQFEWVRNKSVEETLEELKTISDRDFGADVGAWEVWWTEERAKLDIDPEF
jgi:hypothetical protein